MLDYFPLLQQLSKLVCHFQLTFSTNGLDYLIQLTVGTSLAYKYKAIVEVTDYNKPNPLKFLRVTFLAYYPKILLML